MTQNTILSFQIFEAQSFSSGIEINVSATSSIPNQLSMVSIKIAAPKDKIFRGPNPSIITIVGIPSVYEDHKSQYDGNTGFHLMSKGQIQLGSTFNPQEVQITEGIRSQLKIDLLESGMKTVRIQRYSFLDFCQALIGSIIGMMVTIGGLMQFLEILI